MTGHRVEWEGLPGFVRWATPADGIGVWNPAITAAPAAWFRPGAGWSLAGPVYAGRRCSASRCANTTPLGVLERRAANPWRSRRPEVAAPREVTRRYVYCARHVSEYGVHLVGGELLWLRWWPPR